MNAELALHLLRTELDKSIGAISTNILNLGMNYNPNDGVKTPDALALQYLTECKYLRAYYEARNLLTEILNDGEKKLEGENP